MKVSIITLGCKQNKYESDCMARILLDAGYDVVDGLELADIYIINTCAVTSMGERKSKQQLAKIEKLNKNAKVIVCGCASQANINNFKDEKMVFSVIGTEGKDKILDLVNNAVAQIVDMPNVYCSIKNPHTTTTRAHLKIQDGCNRFCSYCLIPYLRGRSRSRDIDEIVSEARNLAKNSHEIVLTGIDISSFCDSDGKLALDKLMERLDSVNANIHIGSLEVNIINDKLMQVLSSMKNFVPHFHLSLQSGSDTVLKRMNRRYTTDEFYSATQLIRKYFNNANITTDIIVGFPGETEEEFIETCKFVQKVNFAHVHIFPYSRRKGTVAYTYADIDKNIKKERVHRLQQIAKDCETDYLTKQIDVPTTLLVEEKTDDMHVGYSHNYVRLYVSGENVKCGCLYNVVPTKLYKDGLIAKIVEEKNE